METRGGVTRLTSSPSCQLPFWRRGWIGRPERSGRLFGGRIPRTGATGVPRPENVLGRIDVGVVAIIAGDAPERRLVRPVLRRHMSAGETGPGGVPGIDPDQASSPSRQLVFEEREERAPSPGENGAVESGLLPDVPSGGLPGPSGASGHVPDLQILDIDDGLGNGMVRRALGLDPRSRSDMISGTKKGEDATKRLPPQQKTVNSLSKELP